MKVAFLLPSLANRGPIVVARDIVDNIYNKVEKVTVFYFDDIVELEFKCDVVKVGIFCLIDFSDYDVVHGHCLRPNLYLKIRSMLGVNKYVSTIHNYVEHDLLDKYSVFIAKYFSIIWLWALSGHNAVVCLSKHAAEYYYGRIKTRLVVVYNGRNRFEGDQELEKPILDELTDFKKLYKVIGASCLLTKRKGLEHIINFLPNHLDFGFVVVGDGPDKDRLVALASQLGVANRCLFLGYRNGAVKYYKYFDFFAMPSRSEGFPLALIEAASCSLPVICSNLPIFKEVFSNDEVSFFELDNNDSFSDAMHLLEANAFAMSNNIYTKYQSMYTAKIMADEYMRLYLSIIERQGLL
jgi:L-malate glycosyltransferase